MLTPYKILEICNQHTITIETFVIGYSIFLSKSSQTEPNKAFLDYCQVNKESINYSKILDELEAKKFLLNYNVKYKYEVSKIVFTDAFKAIFLIDSEIAWNEVISTYPMFLKIDGKKINAQSTKNPALADYYFEKVIKGGNKDLHSEFISLIKGYYKGEKTVEHGTGLEKCLYSWASTRLMLLEELKTETSKPTMYLEL